MSDDEASSLLSARGKGKGKATVPDSESMSASEGTALLSEYSQTLRYDAPSRDGSDRESDGGSLGSRKPSSETLASPTTAPSYSSGKPASNTRWPSIIAIFVLTMLTVSGALTFFVMPDRMAEYAQQALVLEPTSLAVESITAGGVRARVRATIQLDGSRVRDEGLRRMGWIATSIVRTIRTDGDTRISVFLPDFDDALLGTAVLPPLSVSLVDGESTVLDLVADFVSGDADAIRAVANRWLSGNLDQLGLLGRADLQVVAGIIPVGTHSFKHSLVVEAKNLPDLPQYTISGVMLKEIADPDHRGRVVEAQASLTFENPYAVQISIPPVGLDVLLPDCSGDDYILLAGAITKPVYIDGPHTNVTVAVDSAIMQLPDLATRPCADTAGDQSPLDKLLTQYVHGSGVTVFVRGHEGQVPGRHTDDLAPDWLTDVISRIVVPVLLPARSFDDLVGDFSVANVTFSLPQPSADPHGPGGRPRISGTVEVLAAVPSELDVRIGVERVRARANVFYAGRKVGELNQDDWQPAQSTDLGGSGEEAVMLIESRMVDVTLNVTDADALADVVQKLLLDGAQVMLDIEASVDVVVQTALGGFVLKDFPAKGRLPVEPLPGGGIDALQPHVDDIRIGETSANSVQLEVVLSLVNPTTYAAQIPYLSMHVYKNGSRLGEATAHDVHLTPGRNAGVRVGANWNPTGPDGRAVGRELLSQYLSGYNTTVEVRAHAGSIPAVPALGAALGRLAGVVVPVPALELPSGPPGRTPEERGRFVRDASFHVLSAAATFTLASPLRHDTLWIQRVDAMALYNHSVPVGRIGSDQPFPTPPGESRTPRLPVDWTTGSPGFDAVKRALGGSLTLDARANVTVCLWEFCETVWYEGNGIGARVRW